MKSIGGPLDYRAFHLTPALRQRLDAARRACLEAVAELAGVAASTGDTLVQAEAKRLQCAVAAAAEEIGELRRWVEE